jgi:hypothetical protein
MEQAAAGDLNNDGWADFVGLGGRGILTQVQVGAPKPLSPTAWNFGSQKVGTSGAAKPFTFKNGNSAPITVASVKVPAGFTETNTCLQLQPQQTCTINVRFAPTAVGTALGSLTVTFKPSLVGPFPNLTAAIRGQGI